MKKNKDVLKIILVALIAVFVMVGIAAVLLVGYRKSEEEKKAKQQAIDVLESIPRLTPTVVATATPTPLPTATPTPTVVPTIKPAFNPDVYWDSWYSTDGAASVNIYNISLQSVSFLFAQSNADGTVVCEADVTAEVAGNAAQFSFTDSQGNTASGNFTFDSGQLYVRISTTAQANVSVAPNVDCVMVRNVRDGLRSLLQHRLRRRCLQSRRSRGITISRTATAAISRMKSCRIILHRIWSLPRMRSMPATEGSS